MKTTKQDLNVVTTRAVARARIAARRFVEATDAALIRAGRAASERQRRRNVRMALRAVRKAALIATAAAAAAMVVRAARRRAAAERA